MAEVASANKSILLHLTCVYLPSEIRRLGFKPSEAVPTSHFSLVKQGFFGRGKSANRLPSFYMAEAPHRSTEQSPPRKYRWPRFVIAAIILAAVLAAIWLSFEIRRTQRIRELNSPQATP